MRLINIQVLILVLAFGGCQTFSDARLSKGTGIVRTYNASEEQVWSVLPKAVNEVDLAIAGMYQDDGYLLAEHGISLFSWGEKVSVFVEPQVPLQTDVEVVSLSTVSTNITAIDFSKKLLDMIDQMLKHN